MIIYETSITRKTSAFVALCLFHCIFDFCKWLVQEKVKKRRTKENLLMSTSLITSSMEPQAPTLILARNKVRILVDQGNLARKAHLQ